MGGKGMVGCKGWFTQLLKRASGVEGVLQNAGGKSQAI